MRVGWGCFGSRAAVRALVAVVMEFHQRSHWTQRSIPAAASQQACRTQQVFNLHPLRGTTPQISPGRNRQRVCRMRDLWLHRRRHQLCYRQSTRRRRHSRRCSRQHRRRISLCAKQSSRRTAQVMISPPLRRKAARQPAAFDAPTRRAAAPLRSFTIVQRAGLRVDRLAQTVIRSLCPRAFSVSVVLQDWSLGSLYTAPARHLATRRQQLPRKM